MKKLLIILFIIFISVFVYKKNFEELKLQCDITTIYDGDTKQQYQSVEVIHFIGNKYKGHNCKIFNKDRIDCLWSEGDLSLEMSIDREIGKLYYLLKNLDPKRPVDNDSIKWIGSCHKLEKNEF